MNFGKNMCDVWNKSNTVATAVLYDRTIHMAIMRIPK